jgi:hypothetical protein
VWVTNFTPRPLYTEKTRYQSCRGVSELQGQSGRMRNISSPTGFDPPTVQPVSSRYTDWAITAPSSRCGQGKIYFKIVFYPSVGPIGCEQCFESGCRSVQGVMTILRTAPPRPGPGPDVRIQSRCWPLNIPAHSVVSSACNCYTNTQKIFVPSGL